MLSTATYKSILLEKEKVCVCVFASILSGLLVLDMISVFIDGWARSLSLLSLSLSAECLVVSVGFVNVRAHVCLQCCLVIWNGSLCLLTDRMCVRVRACVCSSSGRRESNRLLEIKEETFHLDQGRSLNSALGFPNGGEDV